MFNLLRSNCTAQLSRYVVLGVLMNSVGYLFYLAMTFEGVTPKLAMSIGYAIGLVISFSGNKKWVFSHEGGFSWALARFFLMHVSGYLFNLVSLFFGVDVYGYPHYIVQLCVMVILAGYFFIMLKFFVFVQGDV